MVIKAPDALALGMRESAALSGQRTAEALPKPL
jgi:hypothetical protein